MVGDIQVQEEELIISKVMEIKLIQADSLLYFNLYNYEIYTILICSVYISFF